MIRIYTKSPGLDEKKKLTQRNTKVVKAWDKKDPDGTITCSKLDTLSRKVIEVDDDDDS